MNRKILIPIFFFLAAISLLAEGGKKMNFSSSAFSNGGMIPDRYTCKGENISPELKWGSLPSGTKSLALIVHDPDAPRKGGWTHWVVWNIPPETMGFSEKMDRGAVLSDGTHQGITDYGKPGYKGPCPPSGTHRYFFYLYALDATLNLPGSTTKPLLEQSMEGHILEKAEWMGKYSK